MHKSMCLCTSFLLPTPPYPHSPTPPQKKRFINFRQLDRTFSMHVDVQYYNIFGRFMCLTPVFRRMQVNHFPPEDRTSCACNIIRLIGRKTPILMSHVRSRSFVIFHQTDRRKTSGACFYAIQILWTGVG